MRDLFMFRYSLLHYVLSVMLWHQCVFSAVVYAVKTNVSLWASLTGIVYPKQTQPQRIGVGLYMLMRVLCLLPSRIPFCWDVAIRMFVSGLIITAIAFLVILLQRFSIIQIFYCLSHTWISPVCFQAFFLPYIFPGDFTVLFKCLIVFILVV